MDNFKTCCHGAENVQRARKMVCNFLYQRLGILKHFPMITTMPNTPMEAIATVKFAESNAVMAY